MIFQENVSLHGLNIFKIVECQFFVLKNCFFWLCGIKALENKQIVVLNFFEIIIRNGGLYEDKTIKIGIQKRPRVKRPKLKEKIEERIYIVAYYDSTSFIILSEAVIC